MLHTTALTIVDVTLWINLLLLDTIKGCGSQHSYTSQSYCKVYADHVMSVCVL